MLITSVSSFANLSSTVRCDLLRDGVAIKSTSAGELGHGYSNFSGTSFLPNHAVNYTIPTKQVGFLIYESTLYNEPPKYKVRILKMNQLWDYNSGTVLNELELSKEGDFSLSAKFEGVEFSSNCNLEYIKL